MTIAIELPDRVVATLLEQARAEGRPAADLVVELLVQRFGGERAEEPVAEEA